MEQQESDQVTFASLGVCEELCLSADRLDYKHPTKIQQEAIPYAIKGHDLIALAVTGSGKTAAFAIPVLQKLLENPQSCFALVLTPTRELALQISEQFEALGAFIGLRTSVLVGGLDAMQQAISLTKKPHIIIGTPGRVVDHIEHTKGFSLSALKFLVLDEADRLLNMDFEKEITQIVAAVPQERNTFLFSATMTNKVEKLQRACLRRGAVKVEASEKYQTVDTLTQKYLFIPAKYKDTHLVYILNEFAGSSALIFTDTCVNAVKLYFLLTKLGHPTVALHGKLAQQKRLSALNKFKSREKNILIATDVASRGLDIPSVDLVVNYDVPQNAKNYIHRVGRTARAGRSGNTIILVTQYDIVLFQKIEHMLDTKLAEFPIENKDDVMLLQESVVDAQNHARREMKDAEEEMQEEEELDEEGVKPNMDMLAKKGGNPTGKPKKRGRTYAYHKQLLKKLKY